MNKTEILFNNHFSSDVVVKSSAAAILNDFISPVNYHREMGAYLPSPLLKLNSLARELGVAQLLIKDEGQRYGLPAIKMLGASYAVSQLIRQNPAIKEFCTATDGNHGKAVAWSAGFHNRKATVFVPEITVSARIKAIEDQGASVKIVNGNYDQAVNEASKYAERNAATLVQDTAWDGYEEIPSLITAGYYTQMAEIWDALKADTPDLIFVQAGVGSWPSAIVYYLRKYLQQTKTKLICVEPFESDCFMESAKHNALQPTYKSQKTIMAGLNCGTPSTLAWSILSRGVNAFLTIDDEWAKLAMQKLYYPVGEDVRIASGESGAAGLAGLIALLNTEELKEAREKLGLNKHTRVLVFNTENITDPVFFEKNIVK